MTEKFELDIEVKASPDKLASLKIKSSSAKKRRNVFIRLAGPFFLFLCTIPTWPGIFSCLQEKSIFSCLKQLGETGSKQSKHTEDSPERLPLDEAEAPEKTISSESNGFKEPVENLIKNITNITDSDFKNEKDSQAILSLQYNELATRQQNDNLDESNTHFFEESVKAWASATDFSGKLLTSSKNNVTKLTPEFVEHIQQYQYSKGLKITGDLDYDTLAITANRDINIFLYNVYTDPTAAPTRDNPDQCLHLTSNEISTWQELPVVAQLVRDAEKREQVKDYAKAVLLFNEAHSRIEKARASTNNKYAIENYKMMAIYTELRIYENSGYILNISNPVSCDPIQQRYVMTPAMVYAITDFQERIGIPVTGKLDYSTIFEFLD